MDKSSRKTTAMKRRITSQITAEVVGCSDSKVRQVRSGIKETDSSALSQTILKVDNYLEAEMQKVMQKARKFLPTQA